MADHKAIREAALADGEVTLTAEQIIQLLDENESLSQLLKDFEGCKGVEDYYRVLCELWEVKAENERLKEQKERVLNSHRYLEGQLQSEMKTIRQLEADKAVAIEALEKIKSYYREEGYYGFSVARTTLEQLKRE